MSRTMYTVEDVRAAAREVEAALDVAINAQRRLEQAARALVQTTEAWPAPRLFHSVTQQAEGIRQDVFGAPLETIAQELADFATLVDTAATEREAIDV